jgi:hypothetical protein
VVLIGTTGLSQSVRLLRCGRLGAFTSLELASYWWVAFAARSLRQECQFWGGWIS